jgi:hypothetical protein
VHGAAALQARSCNLKALFFNIVEFPAGFAPEGAEMAGKANHPVQNPAPLSGPCHEVSFESNEWIALPRLYSSEPDLLPYETRVNCELRCLLLRLGLAHKSHWTAGGVYLLRRASPPLEPSIGFNS